MLIYFTFRVVLLFCFLFESYYCFVSDFVVILFLCFTFDVLLFLFDVTLCHHTVVMFYHWYTVFNFEFVIMGTILVRKVV
jgi:hypothetical protein